MPTVEKEFMTDKEQRFKQRLIALLKDDGKGHHHAKFAEKLKDFIIKIVDRREDPNMTAAISFETGTIYISDGFTTNPETFFQLNVLMRHELAHYIMKHQIRMTNKFAKIFGKEGSEHMIMSQSLHNLMNIIEDYEISNTRYSAEDKQLVRNMILGGKVISGLVTEDERANWVNLPLEKMYDELSKEIEQIQQSILASWDNLNMEKVGKHRDFVQSNIKTLYIYTDTKSPTNFTSDLETYMKNRSLYHFAPQDQLINGQLRVCMAKWSNLPEAWQGVIKAIAKEFTTENSYTRQEVRDIILDIAKSSPVTPYNIKDKSGKEVIKLYTPEEKLIANDALKACISKLDLYDTWYNKIKKVLSDKDKYSKTDLERILQEIEK